MFVSLKQRHFVTLVDYQQVTNAQILRNLSVGPKDYSEQVVPTPIALKITPTPTGGAARGDSLSGRDLG